MPTPKQVLGRWGETLVAKKFACPRCKRFFTLRRLPPNFKCADIICDFCGYLAQVKTATVGDVLKVPSSILGAAWGPQRDRMKAGIYFPLFLVLRNERNSAVYYLPTEFQNPRMFKKRARLSATARRAGWQGFSYDLSSIGKSAVVRILPPAPDNWRVASRRNRFNRTG
jgi:Dam-replacing family